MDLTISHHAQIRMQQRSISFDMLDKLLDFGVVCFNVNGAEIIRLS